MEVKSTVVDINCSTTASAGEYTLQRLTGATDFIGFTSEDEDCYSNQANALSALHVSGNQLFFYRCGRQWTNLSTTLLEGLSLGLCVRQVKIEEIRPEQALQRENEKLIQENNNLSKQLEEMKIHDHYTQTWGPVGAPPGGSWFEIQFDKLEEIHLRVGAIIDAIQFKTNNGWSNHFGGNGGTSSKHVIGNKKITKIKIASTTFNHSVVVSHLFFKLEDGRTISDGSCEGYPTVYHVAPNQKIVGFCGRYGAYLDAFGVIVRTWKSLSCVPLLQQKK